MRAGIAFKSLIPQTFLAGRYALYLDADEYAVLPAGIRSLGELLAILARNVRERRDHFLYIARERVGGLPSVRDAIRHELGLFERELATDVARLPGTDAWSSDDLRVLANLIVGSMVETAEAILTSPPGRPDLEGEVVRTAERQLRMVVIGAANWRSEDTPTISARPDSGHSSPR